MPCYAPLRAVLVSGPQGRRLEFSRSSVGKALSLPCGRCTGCRLERSRQWANRIVHETKMHDQSSFLTLTYDPEHLPKDGSISVDDCQRFLKRLRKKLAPRRIRFFLCGEYGEKLGRPHYHAIIFGYDFPDKVKLAKADGFWLYESRELNEIWGLGGCRIGDVSFDSAAYVANYATKKVTNKEAYTDGDGKRWPSKDEHYQGRRPEFLLMSRRPGIGRTWFETFGGDVFPSDEVVVRGVPSKPPRYYVQQIEKRAAEEFPPGRWSDLLALIKANREKQAESLEGEVKVKGYDHVRVRVLESRNARRLRIREEVARAKLALKRRTLGEMK